MSSIEPKNVKEALMDNCWINAMHEELGEFERNNVWELVPRPSHSNVIGTKWIFKNKTDEHVPLLEIKLGWLLKDTLKLRVLILMKLFTCC